MKKTKPNMRLKAFTLLELIIVMAIMSIIMAGLLTIMKPIRTTFVDSTLYENQRNTQNGMCQYLAESVRYSTNLGIYSSASVADLSTAVDKFMKGAAPDGSGGIDATRATELEKTLQIIIIDNSNSYTYGSDSALKGRILRVNTKPTTAYTAYNAAYDVVDTTGNCRLALGSAFYGRSTYSILVKPETNGVNFTVSSVPDSKLMTGTTVSTVAFANCQNLTLTANTPYFDGTTDYSNNSTTAGLKTYIIYTLPPKA